MSKTEYSTKMLAEKNVEKLMESLSFLKRELFNLRFQQAAGELQNSSRFSKVRKDIARVKTELSRRKIAGDK